MNAPLGVFPLIVKEIRFRKLGFSISVAAVAAAAAMLFASESLLRIDRIQTANHLAAKEKEASSAIAEHEKKVAEAGAALQDTVRKQMLKLGFNVLILPEEVDINELHLDGSLSATMPYSYAEKLSNSNIVTVNHLLPTITKRIQWPEQKIDVVIHGTKGEIPIMHRALKQPMLDAVAPGQMVVGSAIQSKLNVKEGDRLTLKGKEFQVSKIQPERGSIDDVSVWIDLAAAQELLGMQNLIHAILALECECTGDRISEVRKEIGKILPGTKVIERYSQALTRAEARQEAQRSAEAALALAKEENQAMLKREKTQRLQIERQNASLSRVLVPTVLVLTCCVVGALAFHNSRQRRVEIGLMRALGLRSSQIFAVFLGKAGITGLLGGGIGLIIGLGFIHFWMNRAEPKVVWQELFQSSSFASTILFLPVMMALLIVLASWLAAFRAVRQDAAVVLQGE